MKLEIHYYNELPFIIELQNGIYDVATENMVMKLELNSDMYKIHVAKFPQFADKNIYYAEKNEIEKIIQGNNINCYGISNCKSFITCKIEFEYEITEKDIDNITREQCISFLKSELIMNETIYDTIEELELLSNLEYEKLIPEKMIEIKKRILVENKFSENNYIYDYYEALNNLISQYSFIRNLHFIYKVDENILQGTQIYKFLNGNFFSTIKFGGLVPNILPYQRVFLDLKEEEIIELKKRLVTKYEIPSEEELILSSKSLWFKKRISICNY